MAITNPNRVGRTRIKLALLLEKEVEGVTVLPQDLESQNPYYASQQMDCCTWMGYGTRNTYHDVYFYSWNTMGNCVKHGISFTQDRVIGETYEVFSEEPAAV